MRKITLKLTQRADGRACKRIDGRLRTWANAEIARNELLALIAIRENPIAALATAAAPPGIVSIRQVCNEFIADREARMTDGRIEKGTFFDYKTAIDEFLSYIEAWKPEIPDPIFLLKRQAPIEALKPEHFRHVRSKWAERLGAWKLDNRIQAVRTAFRWAAEIQRLILSVPHYGDEFHKPSAADKRRAKREREGQHGEHRFAADELRLILASDKCTGAMKCFVLLGLNAGMYAADCAVLKWSDIKNGVIDTYREKTGIRQKCPLWPETIKALDEWNKIRPKPKLTEHAELVFITSHGNPWISESITRNEMDLVVGGGETNSIRLMFDRLLVSIGIKREGVGFGAFRHTHITASSRHPDQNARKVVRGHKIFGIEEHYDLTDLQRLKSVTDLVRRILLIPALSSKPSRAKPKKRKPLRNERRKTAHQRARAARSA